MAKAEIAGAAGKAADANKGPSTLMFLVAMAVLTALAAGAGGFFGMQFVDLQAGPRPSEAHQEKAATNDKTPEHKAGTNVVSSAAGLYALAPIITNLAAPKGTWIRLEGALVFKHGVPKEADLMAGRISADILAFLRTVTLKQIEGASGFLALREDLNERIRIRSGAEVSEIVIRAFIVE